MICHPENAVSHSLTRVESYADCPWGGESYILPPDSTEKTSGPNPLRTQCFLTPPGAWLSNGGRSAFSIVDSSNADAYTPQEHVPQSSRRNPNRWSRDGQIPSKMDAAELPNGSPCFFPPLEAGKTALTPRKKYSRRNQRGNTCALSSKNTRNIQRRAQNTTVERSKASGLSESLA